MNCNQVIRPEIEPIINGGHGGHPSLVKIRRKLGLTFVLSNPFRVSVAQSPAAPDAAEADAAKKAKPESI
jgi:phosphoenolpyruvate synthase/pyruvate phosphate dikinase